jgi:hypothetical protein
MNVEEIQKNLCVYDKRNTSTVVDDEIIWKSAEEQISCFCDNCFTGMTTLANAFLNYVESHSRPNKIDKESHEYKLKNWDVINVEDVSLCEKCNQPMNK